MKTFFAPYVYLLLLGNRKLIIRSIEPPFQLVNRELLKFQL